MISLNLLGAAFLQIGRDAPQSSWDLIWHGTLSTQLVLLVLLSLSMTSWVIIVWKWRQFKTIQKQGDRFLEAMERSQRMGDANQPDLTLPDSPYSRVFRQGVNFFSELRPGALREGSPAGEGLTLTQLEVLRMVLEKEEAEERDELAIGLTWLAVIASVAPLMGLLGTVMGVMGVFLGIVASGSTNIAAVAPGVAEALITTAAGLITAIPAVMAYNYFVARLNLVMSELEGFSAEFIGTLAREGRV
jgi:biopolymer transport protein TolQ